MNPTKLMAVALCAAACVTTTAFAADDDFVTAANATAISDPVNPKQGAIFKGYCINYLNDNKLKELPAAIGNAAPVKTTVVATETFSYEQFRKTIKINQGVWEGFLKCKRTADCTILVKQNKVWYSGFILFVNGKKIVCARGQASAVVNLKAGFNHVKIVAQSDGYVPVEVFLSPTGSTAEPKSISPAILWHDEKPEDDII